MWLIPHGTESSLKMGQISAEQKLWRGSAGLEGHPISDVQGPNPSIEQRMGVQLANSLVIDEGVGTALT
jgi:hypothetical protein